MPTAVSKSDLRPGDILLYQGTTLISRLIRLFDSSEYSHASIWDGHEIIEACPDRVVARDLQSSVSDSRFVDVFRYRNKLTSRILGDDSPLPAKPVLAQAAAFKRNHHRYACEPIILLALLTSTRRITAPLPVLRSILRAVLDSAADVLARIVAIGKEPIISSELVYRSYAQAGPEYAIRVRGADLATTSVRIVMATPGPARPPAQTNDLGESKALFLKHYVAAKTKNAQRRPDPRPPQPPPRQQTLAAVADFVTPGDLRKSPDLLLVGRLDLEATPGRLTWFASKTSKTRPDNAD